MLYYIIFLFYLFISFSLFSLLSSLSSSFYLSSPTPHTHVQARPPAPIFQDPSFFFSLRHARPALLSLEDTQGRPRFFPTHLGIFLLLSLPTESAPLVDYPFSSSPFFSFFSSSLPTPHPVPHPVGFSICSFIYFILFLLPQTLTLPAA